ncbi:MAG: hypothetical protein AAF909_00380 [Pseudomonadota bacterium]
MTRSAHSIFIVSFAAAFTQAPAHSQSVRVTPEIAIESRVFAQDPQFDGQLDAFQAALILSGDLRWTSRDRQTRVRVEPYLRLDAEDRERSYGDIREASLGRRFSDWDVLFGVTQEFWGVAESRNVVDIINQFDTVEDFDQGEKLGQPALRLGRRTAIGRFDAYYLPFFRQQRAPGRVGRVRQDPRLDTDDVAFERGGGRWAGDVALRYTHTAGRFDIGLHAFRGTSRAPLLVPRFGPGGEIDRFTPFYQRLTQGGVDLQFTEGPWLLKVEAVGLGLGDERIVSAVAGFEYTFFDVSGSGADVGLIGEYLYDSREALTAPPTPFDNDAFLGTRVTLNDTQDTELLAGAIIDGETRAVIGTVELQTRLGEATLLELEGRYFDGSGDPLLDPFNRDSHLTLRLTRYF